MSSIPLCSSVMIAWFLAVPVPIDKVVLEQIKLLAPDHAKEQRLGAMAKLEKLATEKFKVVGLSSAIPALCGCLEDKDSQIRKQALTALKALATESQKECHIAVVKALFDTDREVRSTAVVAINAFKKLPKEAIPLLVRGLSDSKREIQACANRQLQMMLSDDPKTKEIIKDLKADEQLRKLLKQSNYLDRVELGKTLGALIYSADAVAEAIKRVASDQSKEVRLAALSDLGCMCHSQKDTTHFVAAIPVLTKCSSSQEKDRGIREEAILLLAGLVGRLKQPCPMVFVEALSEKAVPINAINVIGVFDVYPKEAIPHLLRGLEHKDQFVRQAVVMPLGLCGDKSKKVLGALENATKDSDNCTRHNAELALWKLTMNWDRYVRHLLQRMEDWNRLVRVPKEETAEAKSKRESECFLAVGCVYHLRKLEEDKPEEVIPVLIKLLADPSPVIRKCDSSIAGSCGVGWSQSQANREKIRSEICSEKTPRRSRRSGTVRCSGSDEED